MVKQTIGKWGEGLNLDEILKNALFKNMTLDSLESILNCSKSIYKKYHRGEMIFREEERAQFSVTYNLNIYPVMYDFLHHLKVLNFQKRTFGIIENGTWAIKSGSLMKKFIDEELKECLVLGSQVSVNSMADKSNEPEFESLADALIESINK